MSSAFERVQKLAEEKRLRQQQEKAENEKPKLEIVPTLSDQPNQPNQPNQRRFENHPKAVTPSGDFAKVPNSIVREAVPERYFKGMSKNTYDALYLKTRGAVTPIRKIRATKSDLIRWSGVSDVTIDKHIKHLKSVGLLKVEFIIGSHNGNWYEVLIPEEIETPDIPNQPNIPNPPNIPKKVGGDIPNLVGDVGWVNPIENKGLTSSLKTSLKTNTKNDDEPAAPALRELGRVFAEVSERLTGSGLNTSDEDNWRELAELLAMELEMAAARTDSISNVPAFLTAHMRRRLMRQPEKKTGEKNFQKDKAEHFSQIGKSAERTQESEPSFCSFEIEPLSPMGRETVLKTMHAYLAKGQREFVFSLEDSYTAEDWQWLMNNLPV